MLSARRYEHTLRIPDDPSILRRLFSCKGKLYLFDLRASTAGTYRAILYPCHSVLCTSTPDSMRTWKRPFGSESRLLICDLRITRIDNKHAPNLLSYS
jgi:hypothetical protein